MLASKRPDVRCRLIDDGDLEAVVACLRRGFPYRGRGYWTRALERMSRRAPIGEAPTYGYLLEASRGVVGVLLAIYSRRDGPEGDNLRCNLSSYCVDVDYRGYAPLLHSVAVKRREVTYTNVSPAKHTRAGIEALKFKKFCDGQMLFAPVFSAGRPGARVIPFAAHSPAAALLPERERDLLAEHAALGCRALLGVDRDGAVHPFLLQRRAAFHRLLPCHQLIYCRSLDDFVGFAGAIGRYLLLRAWPIFIADANGPVKGLVGRYFAGHGPKYFKGPAPPTLGDLSYTELVILGP